MLPVTVDGRKRVYNVSVLGHELDGTIRASTPLYFYVKAPSLALEAPALAAASAPSKSRVGARTAGRSPPVADPTDRVLVAYGLTADQEAEFDPSDGRVSPFWALLEGRHASRASSRQPARPALRLAR